MKDVTGILLVVAAIGLIIAVYNPKPIPSAVIGVGITPATPKKKPQVGAGGSAKKAISIRKTPLVTKKTSSGSSGAGAGSKSSGGGGGSGGGSSPKASISGADIAARQRAIATQKATQIKAAERAKTIAAQRVIYDALTSNKIRSPAKRKFLTMASSALGTINRQISLLANPTPAAIQTIKTRIGNALRVYATKIQSQSTSTTSKPKLIPVGGLGMSGLTGDPESSTLTGGAGSGGSFKSNTLTSIINTIIGGGSGENIATTISDAITNDQDAGGPLPQTNPDISIERQNACIARGDCAPR
jgi:hypothetical protein